MGQHLLPEGAAPSTPSTGYVSMYAKADGLLYSKDDAGVETQLALALGVTAGKAQQVDQAVSATVRAATTDFTGESLEGTLSNSGVTITAFHGVAGVTYKRKCLGAGRITARIGLTIPQGRASINTAAGDTFEVYMLTSTTCEVRNYVRGSVSLTPRVMRDVMSTRALGTSYTNTTGRTISVNVAAIADLASGFMFAVIGGVTANGSSAGVNGYLVAISFEVENGAAYSIGVSGGGTLFSWTELR